MSEHIKEDLERENGGRGRRCMVDSCTHLGQEDRQKVEGERTWEENPLEPCLGQVTLHFDPGISLPPRQVTSSTLKKIIPYEGQPHKVGEDRSGVGEEDVTKSTAVVVVVRPQG